MPLTRAPINCPGETTRRRLRSLAVLELLNIPLHGWLWFGAIGLPPTAVNISGFAAFAVLLVVGAVYWALKLRQLRRREPHLPGRRQFAAVRAVLPVVLAVVLIVCVIAVAREPGAASWPGLAFAFFGALEYVNYFHVQLMHDNRADLRRLGTVGFRRAHLSRDLRSVTAADRQVRRATAG